MPRPRDSDIVQPISYRRRDTDIPIYESPPGSPDPLAFLGSARPTRDTEEVHDNTDRTFGTFKPKPKQSKEPEKNKQKQDSRPNSPKPSSGAATTNHSDDSAHYFELNDLPPSLNVDQVDIGISRRPASSDIYDNKAFDSNTPSELMHSYETINSDTVTVNVPKTPPATPNGQKTYDNLAYEDTSAAVLATANAQPGTFAGRHVYETPKPVGGKSSEHIYDDLKTGKQAEKEDLSCRCSCENRGCRCVTALLLLAVVITATVLLVLFFIVFPSNETTPKPTFGPTTPVVTESTVFSGEVRLSSNWSNDLANSSSEKYNNLSRELILLIDDIFKNSSDSELSDNYNSTVITRFSQGSVKALFTLIFDIILSTEKVQTAIETGFKEKETAGFLPWKILDFIIRAVTKTTSLPPTTETPPTTTKTPTTTTETPTTTTETPTTTTETPTTTTETPTTTAETPTTTTETPTTTAETPTTTSETPTTSTETPPTTTETQSTTTETATTTTETPTTTTETPTTTKTPTTTTETPATTAETPTTTSETPTTSTETPPTTTETQSTTIKQECVGQFKCSDGQCIDNAKVCNRISSCSDWSDEENCGFSISCDFEQDDICGYYFNQTQQYRWYRRSGFTPTVGTGPDNDHTLRNNAGHYMYVEGSNQIPASRTSLVLPMYNMNSSNCLRFYYNMYGSGIGSLHLFKLDKARNTELLWSRVGEQGESWMLAEVELFPGQYILYLEAYHGSSTYSDIAVDDILVQGSCSVFSCPTDQFLCKKEKLCIPMDKKCDGTFDCSNQEDEEFCPDSGFDCSFEDGTFCDWVAESNSPMVWGVQPGYDHTTESVSGYFAYVDPSKGSVGDATTLTSPNIMYATSETCLRLHYHLFGETPTVVKVFIHLNDSVVSTIQLKPEHTVPQYWKYLQLTLPGNGTVRVVIEATRGSNTSSFVILDDLTLRPGACSCNQYEFQCSAGSCIRAFEQCDSKTQCVDGSDEINCVCPLGQVQCSQEQKCIMAEWVCDGQADCVNGTDEANCGTCLSDSFVCNNHQCVSNAARCDGKFDCMDGSDERQCVKTDPATYMTSLLFNDDFLYICTDGWADVLNDRLCRAQGLGKASQRYAVSVNALQYLHLNTTDGFSFDNLYSWFVVRSQCSSGKVVGIQCQAQGCGTRSPNVAVPYIINGQDSLPGKWPWQISLRYKNQHKCGGSLINNDWILTAAHCVDQGIEATPNYVDIQLGTTKRTQADENRVMRGVSKVILHPKYTNLMNGQGYYNGYDAALLLLNSPVNYTDYVRPICLPEKLGDQPPSSAICYATGWGYFDADRPGVYPENLQEGKFRIYPSDRCNSSSVWLGLIRDTNLCAGYDSGYVRSCLADSGGPLQCLDKYNHWLLYGLTSWGDVDCKQFLKPDVFTRTDFILDWVKQQTACTFQCDNGRCLYSESALCDGNNDCGDSSDEGSRACKPTVSCNFDDQYLCGYQNPVIDDDQWLWTTGHAPNTNAGPSFDHTTGLQSGGYLYTTGLSIWSLTPTFTITQPQCLQFYYHIRGSSPGSLIVFKVPIASDGGEDWTRAANLFSTPISDGEDMWKYKAVDVPAEVGQFRFAFFGRSSDLDKKTRTSVAVDDVVFTLGSCSSQACGLQQFTCVTSRSCIPLSLQCDGIKNCLDGSDEMSCTNDISYRCTFDDPYLCGFKQSLNDQLDWTANKGPTTSPNTGPSVDKTTLSNNTYYVYTNSTVAAFGNKARLELPLRPLTGDHCLIFHYHMSGPRQGVLYVYAGQNKSSLSVRWELFRKNGQYDWSRGQITLSSDVSHVVFETYIGGTGQSDIALDEIYLRPSDNCGPPFACAADEFKCTTTSVCVKSSQVCDKQADCPDLSDEANCGYSTDCSFDNGNCGYVHAPFGSYFWERHSGPTESTETGPANDHTLGNSSGSYMYVEATNGYPGQTAFMLSPASKITAEHCLHFFYHMYAGEGGMGTLSIYRADLLQRDQSSLWLISGNRGDMWHEAQIPVAAGTFLFQFLAAYGGFGKSDIAIDDISLKPGVCDPLVCGPTEFACHVERKCLKQEQVCDGLFDCYDFTDESSCQGHGQEYGLDCRFDDFNNKFCDYRQASGDGFDWTHQYGPTRTLSTGPTFDHTFANNLGGYVYMEASLKTSGLITKLYSPRFTASSESCLRFFYHMYGAKMGRLLVSFTNASSTELIWEKIGDQGNHWNYGQVNIQVGATDQQVIFTGWVGQGDTSDIALDDITLRGGSCVCKEDEYTCSNGECIPLAQKCDVTMQCTDGSDEGKNRCNYVCGRDQFTCDNGQCIDSRGLCNTLAQCDDQSDETHCECAADQFRCNNGVCKYVYTWCNNYADCPGGEDELAGCQCRQEQFQCDGICLPGFQVFCNGINNCANGADEPANCSACDNQYTFSCKSDGRCLRNAQRCDMRFDCNDKSDELNCSCSDGFRCNSGHCIESVRVCDAVSDCPDGSDELPTCLFNCNDKQRQCDSGHCVDSALWCDNVLQCADGTDERNCTCYPNEFQCDNGVCIPASGRCNAQYDCLDKSDENNCSACNDSTMFHCGGGVCIDSVLVCDGIAQCPDGSDEYSSCLFHCEDRQRQCVSGQCIDSSLWCDSIMQCLDGSDEKNCTCSPGEFRCSNGVCIHQSRQCNMLSDCGDLSDESNCTCSADQFRCDSGLCIYNNRVCDGQDQCGDNSDEINCVCRSDQVECIHDGKCIQKEWLCDGSVDCVNGTDESNCETCQEGALVCADYTCVLGGRCDGVVDCSDSSDEANCLELFDVAGFSSILHIRHDTGWVPVCFDNWDMSQDWNDRVCVELGEIQAISYSGVKLNASSVYYKKDGPSSSSPVYTALSNSSNCSGSAVKLTCSETECGKSAQSILVAYPYVIGGTFASITTWPWTGAVYYLGQFLGGAVLISPRWAITVFHLFDSRSRPDIRSTVQYYEIQFGSTSQVIGAETNAQRVRLMEVHKHPTQDLAMVKFDRDVNYTSYVRPVCLPGVDEVIPASRTCFTAGWGFTFSTAGRGAELLRDAKMDVWTTGRCHAAISASQVFQFENDTMICAGYESGRITTCHGDSGGPLMCMNMHRHWVLAGVLRSGLEFDCSQSLQSRAARPNIFARIAHFIPWMQQIQNST